MQLNQEKYNVAVYGEISLRLFTPFAAFFPHNHNYFNFLPIKRRQNDNFSENRPFFVSREGTLVYIHYISWWKLILPTESPSRTSVGVVTPQVQNMNTLLVLVLVVIVCSVSIYADSGDLDNLKFSENDPTLEKVQTTSSRSFTTSSLSSRQFDDRSENDNGESPSHSSLKEFLETYADKIRKNKIGNQKTTEDDDDIKSQKSWNLLDIQKHRYPTDDRKGYPIDDRLGFSTDTRKGYPYSTDDRKGYPYPTDDRKTYLHSADNRKGYPYSTDDRKTYPYSTDDRKGYPYSTDDRKGYPYSTDERKGYPTDDRKGWVTLDPIPWSISKVSKWKPKPAEVPWNSHYNNQDQNHWDNDFPEDNHPLPHYHYNNKKPEVNKDGYKVYYINDKNPVVNKPFSRPFTVYDQHVQTNYHKTPININDFLDRPQEPTFHGNQDGIITDRNPPNFPIEELYNRRSGQEEKPEPHPFLGQGEWVLLSTTRGYKAPRLGQKSLEIKPQSIRSQKSVQITVLPPLKNSKINMTTSHGGLLQVESTFETVEQAHKKFQKQQKEKTKKRKRLNGQLKRRKKKTAKNLTNSTLATVPRSTEESKVLTAVGTGMIPATMAMLLPMVNGRKRRRKRELFTTIDPNTNIEITLPRYI